MSFYTGVPEFPDYETIVGTPEEIIQGARTFPSVPLESLWARCLRCRKVQSVARYRYRTELVTLPDGKSVTADRWADEAAKASYMRGRRFRFFCADCDGLTFHIAEKGR